MIRSTWIVTLGFALPVSHPQSPPDEPRCTRSGIAGLGGFVSVSRIEFGEQTNLLTATYLFPDRARWHFEAYDKQRSQHQFVYRIGDHVRQLETGQLVREDELPLGQLLLEKRAPAEASIDLRFLERALLIEALRAPALAAPDEREDRADRRENEADVDAERDAHHVRHRRSGDDEADQDGGHGGERGRSPGSGFRRRDLVANLDLA